jgi:hypothetical protein
LKSAPIAADANSVISANGGLDVDLSNGFVLKGKVQQGQVGTIIYLQSRVMEIRQQQDM